MRIADTATVTALKLTDYPVTKIMDDTNHEGQYGQHGHIMASMDGMDSMDSMDGMDRSLDSDYARM